MNKFKIIGREAVSWKFLFKFQKVNPKNNSQNTIWIVDPFTQVKSAEHMAKFNTKSISNRGTFCNFSLSPKRKIFKTSMKHFDENGYPSLRFPNMVKVNIHEHWTRVTRFNPLWVSDVDKNKSLLKTRIWSCFACYIVYLAVSPVKLQNAAFPVQARV